MEFCRVSLKADIKLILLAWVNLFSLSMHAGRWMCIVGACNQLMQS